MQDSVNYTQNNRAPKLWDIPLLEIPETAFLILQNYKQVHNHKKVIKMLIIKQFNSNFQ